MAATLARLRVNFGSKAPTSAQLGPTCGPIWEQLRPKLKPIWFQNEAHCRSNPKSSKRTLRLKQRSQFGVKLLPKGPKLRHFGHDLDFHVHQFGGPSESLWAQLQPNMTIWRQLGLRLGPRFAKLGPLGMHMHTYTCIYTHNTYTCIYTHNNIELHAIPEVS